MTHWLVSSIAVIAMIAGVYAWVQMRALTSAKYQNVSYTVPSAPRLAALSGETVFRIDPSRSRVSYAVDERIVGQSASRATGSTSGIAGDLAVNRAAPAQSRVGPIVVNVEELHSDNSLRDARIRQDFLESHADPLATFTTVSLSGLPSSMRNGQSYPFTMTGTLDVHRKTAPVTWQARAALNNGALSATATTHVKMSAFGIGPISLVGLVSTGDDVALTMTLVGVDPSKSPVSLEIAAPASPAHRGPSPSFSHDIEPVLAASCASCHSSGQVGAEHWVLDTAGDAAKGADGIGVVTRARYMPPWPASAAGVPLSHSKALDQKTIDTLLSWAQAGGRLDVAASTPITAVPGAAGPVPRRDVALPMPQAYTGLSAVPNDYRCFVLDPHFTAPTFLTGYTVTPDQRREIHHAQIFHIDAAQAREGAARSGADGRPGWSCYAGPSLPDRPAGSGHANGSASPRARSASARSLIGQPGLIAGWVPGQDPVIYPGGSGVLLAPGDALVFQVHYHYDRPPTPDQSTVALQTDPGTAAIRPIEIVNPIGPVEIPCMPGDTAPLCDRSAALHDDGRLYGPAGTFIEPGLLLLCHKTPEQLTAGFNGVAASSCDTRVPQSGQIVGAMGHMHTLGAAFRLTLDPGAPTQQTLLDIPTWNFDWQMNYELATPVHVTAGQKIRMDCSWDRSLDPNRPAKYIVFAEGTEDEMCFSTYALIPDSASTP